MTYQGMRRDNISRTAQSYILIPDSGNKLPERIEAAQALRLVQDNAGYGEDDIALHKIFDRIQDKQELASCVRGMTQEGLLIYGTMANAFDISHTLDTRELSSPAAVESNVTFLGGIRTAFKGSMEHYTGRARESISSISSAFDSFAGAATTATAHTRYNEPRLALAA